MEKQKRSKTEQSDIMTNVIQIMTQIPTINLKASILYYKYITLYHYDTQLAGRKLSTGELLLKCNRV